MIVEVKVRDLKPQPKKKRYRKSTKRRNQRSLPSNEMMSEVKSTLHNKAITKTPSPQVGKGIPMLKIEMFVTFIKQGHAHMEYLAEDVKRNTLRDADAGAALEILGGGVNGRINASFSTRISVIAQKTLASVST